MELFEQDPALFCFDAVVTDCREYEDGYAVTLSQTAFSPEEGGQYGDRGMLNDLPVLDTRRMQGAVCHLVACPLAVGTPVRGQVDRRDRMEKMQCHTAEHILCGTLHRMYGVNNVGFHLGRELVTLDIDALLTEEQLAAAETAANAAVLQNLPVRILYPTPQQAKTMTFRSKLTLAQGLRIVDIPGVDTCACCAPHVSFTGQVGLIKLLGAQKHRGGLRLTMTAGLRALADYGQKHTVLKTVATALSVKPHEAPQAVARLTAALAESRLQYKSLRLEMMRQRAAALPPVRGNAVALLPTADYDELRAFALAGAEKCTGICVALGPMAGGLHFVFASAALDVGALTPQILKALGGKGGGRGGMAQGTLTASEGAVRAYFAAPPT